MSNLEKHAEAELRRAGWFDKDGMYDGMIGPSVMKLIKVFADEGHSGMSGNIALNLFNRVARFKTIAEITNDPAEWMDVADAMPGREAVWQSRRDPSLFSNDGGKTYYSVDDKKRTLKTAADPGAAE